MSNATCNGLVVVSTQYAPAWIMVARGDIPVLACLDRWMLNPTPYLCYQTHMAVAPGHKMFKPAEVWQYGEGIITRGLLILSVDKQRREAYDVTVTDTREDGNLLIKQGLTAGIEGHQFDVTLFLSGVGIVLRETVLVPQETQ